MISNRILVIYCRESPGRAQPLKSSLDEVESKISGLTSRSGASVRLSSGYTELFVVFKGH